MLIVQIQVNLGGTAHTPRCSSALWVQSYEPQLNRYTAATVSPEAILAQEYSRAQNRAFEGPLLVLQCTPHTKQGLFISTAG